MGEIIVAANGAQLVVWTRMRRASARPAEEPWQAAAGPTFSPGFGCTDHRAAWTLALPIDPARRIIA